MSLETVTTRVPLLDLARQYRDLQTEIDGAIAACLQHQQWIQGPEVTAFESAVASFLGVPHAIGVSSGTDALVLALRALALMRTGKEYFSHDDHIVTTAFTFTATADAIVRAGATPVFVDIDPSTYVISAEAVEEYLRHASGRVVGILPVHLYGQMCDMDRIMALARAHGLFVVEDTAQAMGASWQQRAAGTIGDAGTFSFFPSKTLGGFGDGGLVATSHAQLAELIRELVSHGGRDKYRVSHIGYNARLDTIQAAILLAKLPSLDRYTRLRQHIAMQYTKAFCSLPGVQAPVVSLKCVHVYHQYTLAVPALKRTTFREVLQEQGVGSAVYYPTPLHCVPLFADGRALCGDTLVHTQAAAQRVVSIPIDPLLSSEEVDHVISRVYAALSVPVPSV